MTKLDDAQLRTVLDALDVAADYKRDMADECSECDRYVGDVCTTCHARLAAADEYDTLAETLRGES